MWTGWDEPNDSAEAGSDEPNQVVADDYCMVTDAGGFQLLLNTGGEPDPRCA